MVCDDNVNDRPPRFVHAYPVGESFPKDASTLTTSTVARSEYHQLHASHSAVLRA